MHGILPGPSVEERLMPRYGATEAHTLPARSQRRPRGSDPPAPAGTEWMSPMDMSVGATSPRRAHSGASSGRRRGVAPGGGRRHRDRAPDLGASAAALSATGQLDQAIDEDYHSGARINVRTSSMHHHHQKHTMHHTAERTLRRGECEGGVLNQSTINHYGHPDHIDVTAGMLFAKGADMEHGALAAQHIGWHGELVAGSKTLPFGEVNAGAMSGKSGPMQFTHHVDYAVKRHTTKLASTNHL